MLAAKVEEYNSSLKHHFQGEKPKLVRKDGDKYVYSSLARKATETDLKKDGSLKSQEELYGKDMPEVSETLRVCTVCGACFKKERGQFSNNLKHLKKCHPYLLLIYHQEDVENTGTVIEGFKIQSNSASKTKEKENFDKTVDIFSDLVINAN